MAYTVAQWSHASAGAPGIILVIVLLAACTSDDGGDAGPSPSATPQSPTASPTATVPATATSPPTASPSPTAPAPPPGFHPSGTRTGVDAVDRVIEAVERDARGAVAALVFTYDQECGAPPVYIVGHNNPDAWPCDDLPDGAVVQLFHIGICEGERKSIEELEVWVDALFDPAHNGYITPVIGAQRPLYLYEVLAVPPASSDKARYLAIFGFELGGLPRMVWITPEGTITSLSYGCGPDPIEISTPSSFPVVLAPLPR